ncbi:uncharacterized protein VTP21DRAFT_8826 [Calcarisporiella thermophila]|uniref:uncharacterized protein n=1 Tax=Calcarisporiella thermophila TaxID=911321 RepID=UPI00374372AE
MSVPPDKTDDAYIEIGEKKNYRLEHVQVEELDNIGLIEPGCQVAYLEEEELKLWIYGYRFSLPLLILYYTLCLITAGILFLLGRWMPKLYIKLTGRRVPLGEADYVVIKNEWGEVSIVKINSFAFNGKVSSAFSGDAVLDAAQTMSQLKYFDYRYIRFIYHPELGRFFLNGGWKDIEWTDLKVLRIGLSQEKYTERKLVFGKNQIDIHEKSNISLLINEVLHPFFIFQLFSICLWSAYDYYYYASCIFVISVVSITITLIETRRNYRRMREMSRLLCDVSILRDKKWRIASSEELVPGDIIDITGARLQTFPADCILISGDCIVNESMLTGESVPVGKTAASNQALEKLDLSTGNLPPDVARHFLFSGTRIVRARGVSEAIGNGQIEQRALALVVRTGFNTNKGSLIRSMLLPRPNVFKFYRDSFKFLGVLAVLALCGFAASIYLYVRLEYSTKDMILRALDLITIIVPPALPAAMSVGINFALGRLRRKEIYCISPNHINAVGKVDMFCFDKTGTLTEDGLDILGVRLVDSEENEFSDLHANMDALSTCLAKEKQKESAHQLVCAMASCQGLSYVDDQLIGDPLELRMFEFTGWTLEENVVQPNDNDSGTRGGVMDELEVMKTDEEDQSQVAITVVRSPPPKEKRGEYSVEWGSVECAVLRRFEFIPSLRRMSVIAKRLGESSLSVYVKGAPEVIRSLCTRGIPEDFDEELGYYTHRGFRVIAVGVKTLDFANGSGKGSEGRVNWALAHQMAREEAESDLEFVGFVIFENKLKPETAPVVATLHAAKIRQVMCTGDNVLTAISVARGCSLLPAQGRVYVSQLSPGEGVIWENTKDPMDRLDPITLRPTNSIKGASLDYDLAVTGEAFNHLINYVDRNIMNRVLVKGVVFARMSPDEKKQLVQLLQCLGYVVGFCGDGANDCGALRAADAGLSLSEAEASVAAPFTSRTMDIRSVIKLVREGRCALVTSFSCFKYMALYSVIQFTTAISLYNYASDLGDFQFLYIDLLLILPLAVLMGRTGAYRRIDPRPPTASLVSTLVLLSMIGQAVLQMVFQLIIYYTVTLQPWYTPPEYDPEGKNIENYQNTSLFYFSSFLYISLAVVLSVGAPYRKPMWTNVPYVVFTALVFLLTLAILMSPTHAFAFLQVVDTPYSWRGAILGAVVGYFAFAYLSEKYLFPILTGCLDRFRKKRTAKPWKRVLEEMECIER